MLSGRVWWDVLRPFSGQVHFWDQKAAGIIRRSTHDAAAQALVPGGGLGRSVGRTRFENVSSFRVCRTRQDTDRAELSSAPAWVMSAASWPVSSPKMGCAGPWTWREVLLGEIASLDETERCVGRATELRFGLPLGVLGKNAPGTRRASAVVGPLRHCAFAFRTPFQTPIKFDGLY